MADVVVVVENNPEQVFYVKADQQKEWLGLVISNGDSVVCPKRKGRTPQN